MEESAREIIDASDRFGVTNLKLEAEAYLVQKATFTVENILDNLLYADSKNCALLLERAMDFVVENKDEIKERSRSLTFLERCVGRTANEGRRRR